MNHTLDATAQIAQTTTATCTRVRKRRVLQEENSMYAE